MDGKTRFWALAEDHLAREGVEKSTMMGFPCLRRDGTFYACTHRTTGDLIIKASRDRVATLCAEGLAQPFAPNGRVFKEWAAIPATRHDTWPARLEEAFAFAGAA